MVRDGSLKYKSSNNQIHIANGCGEGLYVLVLPFQTWNWGERGFHVESYKNGSSGEIQNFGVYNLASLSELIKNVNRMSSKTIESTNGFFLKEDSHSTNSLEEEKAIREKIMNFLEKDAIKIPFAQNKKLDCDDNNNSLRTLSLSGWGSLFGVQDVTLFIVTQNLTRQAAFKTNFDCSWVVLPNEIVRAGNEDFWNTDQAKEVYQFVIFGS